ncbi:type II secretion system F family protein [Paeniglutamicibacter sp. NPDC012692]|uniref:type II secretion system F family protein n=1 Tax=Paeniglutamicibacter sp. NPDC012692 TaxID=3364388 RepID=UPI0036CE2355
MAYLVAGFLAGLALWMWSGNPSARSAEADRTRPEAPPAGPRESPSLVLEMCATLLESGLPVRSVLEIVGGHVPGYAPLTRVSRALELNVDWERAWRQVPDAVRELEPSLRFTQLSGAPAAKLLRSAAASGRKREIREAEARGAEFGIKLVIPLGLCALPAFVCLGVVPIVISLLPDF